MENENKHSYELVKNRDNAKVVADWFDEGLRIIIISLHSHFTAYIGIPLEHPLASFDYDDLPINAHGGLTFSDKGNGKLYPKDFWWYGWDYAHVGDYTHYNLDDFPKDNDDHNWTLKEVKEDCWETIYDFKKLMKIAEKIKTKLNN